MTTVDGSSGCRHIQSICIHNSNGIELKLCNLGAAIHALLVPDKMQEKRDIILGHAKLQDYLGDKNAYFGATIGRCAGKISGGRFCLNGITYELSQNKEGNHLHGGAKGLDQAIWHMDFEEKSNTVVFRYTSPDGEDGYPGTLQLVTAYTLTQTNELIVKYWAKTDKTTIVNITNHAYLNLAGHDCASPAHVMTLDCDQYTPFDRHMLPTGEVRSTQNTPLDFLKSKPLNDGIRAMPSGFDHYLVARGHGMKRMMDIYEPNSGIKMQVFSTQRGAVLYANGDLKHVVGKNGVSYNYCGWFCIEPQGYPNAVNTAGFPSVVLKAGRPYFQKTIYKFSWYHTDN